MKRTREPPASGYLIAENIPPFLRLSWRTLVKSERAIRRALKRWERLADADREPNEAEDRVFIGYHHDGWGWISALAWVLDFSPDPTLKNGRRG